MDFDEEDDAALEEDDILRAVGEAEPQHPEHRLVTFEEHGQPWAECLECGRQWSVHETETELGEAGIGLEMVSEGDGYCDENPADE
jgi:hypothetical protein